MNGLQKGGGCLSLLALPFLCLSIFMMLDPEPGKTALQGFLPGAFFGSALLFPGLALSVAGLRARRASEFLEAVTGMVRSHDRFSVPELAHKIGRTELETEGVLARIIAGRNGVDLVFHRSTREYFHRARLAAGVVVVERCNACGAPTQNQVLFPGEMVACTYCGVPLGARRG